MKMIKKSKPKINKFCLSICLTSAAIGEHLNEEEVPPVESDLER
jgi:hypothetical protein